VWSALLGNPLRITPLLFDYLSARNDEIRKGRGNGDANSKHFGLIQTDISRTFAGLSFFQKGSKRKKS
jgi:hypothetical protein